jgi:methyltransferase (TIGR00027 family)
VEGGAIFTDPLARPILGPDPDALIERFRAADPAQKRLRLFVAARSRFAEDSLGRAVGRGVRQAVILGAGLDTFSLRNPFAPQGLRVLEVDHPATQAWKRKPLAEAGLAIPASLTFAPIDLELQDLASGLAGAGLQSDQPAFFHWLGVVPYLQRAAVTSTLRVIARVPGSEVVFDYTEPLEVHAEERQAYVADLAARTAALGEEWQTYLDPADLSAELASLGFDQQEDLGLAEIGARYWGQAWQPAEQRPGPHLVRARRAAH